MQAIVDRFENDSAVLELDDGGHAIVAKSLLPHPIREGTAIRFVTGHWVIDDARTRILKLRVRALMDDLFE